MEDLLYEVRDGIGFVTFNRPQARNAMTFAMYQELARIAGAVAEDDEIRALVLTGAGDKAFVSGTDISQFREFRTAADAQAYEQRVGAVLAALERCPKPTIAAIAGACTGGGAAIAMCCDLRIGASNVRMGMPIAKTLGNTISMAGLSRLAALVGQAGVKDLIFTARLLDAAEAKAIGFLSEIVDPPEDLPARAEALARTVAGHAPLTLRAVKEALWRLRQDGVGARGEDLVAMCFTSEDFQEGVDAFLARRKPIWRGR